MRRHLARSLLAVLLALLIVFMLVPVASAAGYDTETVYVTRTEDGVRIGLKRYRPDSSAPFRAGAQPLILMPGLSSNINCFDICTPPGERYNVELPDDAPRWARRDYYIRQDPMRYYNMAHYLWLQGYDVWLANYRGEGRAPYRSGGAYGYSIDELGIYDMPAIVGAVFDITGQHPVWAGHSMGSSMAYIYLEGCRFGNGWNPHVISDPALRAERNGGNGRQSLKGFIDLDGPIIPMNSVPDVRLLCAPLSIPLYINLRPITRTLGEVAANPLMLVETMAWYFYKYLGLPDLGIANALFTMNPGNLEPGVMQYLAEYGADGMSTRTCSQYVDACMNGKFREDYKNGGLNCLRALPPRPRSRDGYYYFSDHINTISIPSLVIADATLDITSPADIENFYQTKTRHPLDKFFKPENTAHLDVVMGLNAPTRTFPKIKRWLKALCN